MKTLEDLGFVKTHIITEHEEFVLFTKFASKRVKDVITVNIKNKSLRMHSVHEYPHFNDAHYGMPTDKEILEALLNSFELLFPN